MLTSEKVKKQSSTRAVRDSTPERLSYLISEARVRIELFTSRPFVDDDARLEVAHFRLVEGMALTDNDEVLGAEARGIMSESDQGYSWSVERAAVTTGSPLVDSLLRQWMSFTAETTDGGNVKAMIL
ncbi:DUF3199 family protein [Brevibacillus porteri]|uniref:DUF3199 family protein n=1 Tax=Brevibacillus porteri TaxID=2126350 RepID=A0ABX5FHC1_9BACL|nr:DUF3199 family protein [Brevibacillus porteri]MED1802248.1 DUF3199 family protein [Brevibacillus porteri]MED2130005.1 DUF3199 family protein [Brevibacillus porteri]MED2745749.1 DUF3199 family protein [Brevibacillus porteri]MED2816633.1 DUF3199 family protein [Brevibacillus porteri]MED2897364.1 DUF3199 family protein [Brevibacillus porteri]